MLKKVAFFLLLSACGDNDVDLNQRGGKGGKGGAEEHLTEIDNLSLIDLTDILLYLSKLVDFKASLNTAKKQSPPPSLSTIEYFELLRNLLIHLSVSCSL